MAKGEKFGRGGTEKKGASPYFGSIPDLGSNAEGYALQGVAENGPAEQGGLKAGDIIIGVAENKIGNLDDFDSALRKFKGGDTVEITVNAGTKNSNSKSRSIRRSNSVSLSLLSHSLPSPSLVTLNNQQSFAFHILQFYIE